MLAPRALDLAQIGCGRKIDKRFEGDVDTMTKLRDGLPNELAPEEQKAKGRDSNLHHQRLTT